MELYLNNYGTSLHVENGQFVIIHADGKQLVDASKVRLIQLSKGAKITSDAVMLAIEHEIDVLFTDTTGNPRGRVWSVKYGSISTIRRKQAEFIYTTQAVEWIKDILAQKIENQIALLYAVATKQAISDEWFKLHPEFQKNINSLKDYRQKIRQLKADLISDAAPSLRGWEGIASKKYFETISGLLPERYRFEERSQHPARDAVNCLLNYGYGILYGKIEGALIKAGVDPYLGVFHRENYNRPVLVFDIIELFRHWIDYVVVDLCMQEAVSDDWFSATPDGIYWLEALGKRILIQSVNDYMYEIIEIDGLQRSRQEHIQQYAYKLASMFENFNL